MNKALIFILTPFAMTVGFVHILFRDVGRAFKAAWLEAKIELGAARREWDMVNAESAKSSTPKRSLFPVELLVLETLREHHGMSEAAVRNYHDYGDVSGDRKIFLVTAALMSLEQFGMATSRDASFGKVWIRTPAGTSALSKARLA